MGIANVGNLTVGMKTSAEPIYEYTKVKLTEGRVANDVRSTACHRCFSARCVRWN